jgi:hypothetical protein
MSDSSHHGEEGTVVVYYVSSDPKLRYLNAGAYVWSAFDAADNVCKEHNKTAAVSRARGYRVVDARIYELWVPRSYLVALAPTKSLRGMRCLRYGARVEREMTSLDLEVLRIEASLMRETKGGR